MPHTLIPPREVTNARRLDEWLIDKCRMQDTTEVPRRDVQNRGPNRVRQGVALDNALAELVAAGRVRQVTRGRHALIAVNPALLRGAK